MSEQIKHGKRSIDDTRGVKILTSNPAEQPGTKRISQREPDKLETTIEVGLGDGAPLDDEGRRQYQ